MRVEIEFAATNYFDTTKAESKPLKIQLFGYVVDMQGQGHLDEIEPHWNRKCKTNIYWLVLEYFYNISF